MIKNRCLKTLLLTGALATGFLVASGLPFGDTLVTRAYAAETVQCATLNNAQVSFNNEATTTVQCYNINGYNYVPIRAITNAMDVEVYPLQNGETGIMIVPSEKPKDKSALEKLVVEMANVNVTKGMVYYDSTGYEADCFLFRDRYYFKLADIAAASDNSLDGKLAMTEVQAKGGIATEATKKIFIGIGVEWNEEIKTISVTRKETDLQKIFTQYQTGQAIDIVGATSVGGNTVIKTEIQPAPVNDKNTSSTNNGINKDFKGSGVLTSAPKVGEVLANILVDETKSAYKDTAMTQVDYSNLEIVYATSNIGGCNWYATGRFAETYGVTSFKDLFISPPIETKKWVEAANSGKYSLIDGTFNKNDIVSGCIAVWETHVTFVEYVEYDSSGNPIKVYYTDSNYGHDGIYRPESADARVKVKSFDEFLKSISSGFVGYVTVK